MADTVELDANTGPLAGKTCLRAAAGTEENGGGIGRFWNHPGDHAAQLAAEDILSLFNPVFSARQLRGVVTRVVPETADSATIFFRPGRGWQAHLAGQWARIGVELDGVRHWRSYSLSAPAGRTRPSP